MNGLAYQEAAERTMNIDVVTPIERLKNASLGLCGESGEIADAVKKHLFHKHDLDRKKVLLEIGDVQWYVAQMCSGLGRTVQDVDKNVAMVLRDDIELWSSVVNLCFSAAVVSKVVLGEMTNKKMNSVNIFDYLLDVQFELCQICAVFGTTIDEIREMNITKLNNRYKEGFTYKASQNRVE